ncbi:hypothetical protein [Niallia sp. Krafla_26]|uniref:hypothetical protein n=1 Tax=Niallia sp. Krafla_26 TaxID=3064703 RepID=UPI003D16E441
MQKNRVEGCGCGNKSLHQKNQFGVIKKIEFKKKTIVKKKNHDTLLNRINDNTKLNIEQINQESYLEQSVNQLDNASQNLPTEYKPVSKRRRSIQSFIDYIRKKISKNLLPK